MMALRQRPGLFLLHLLASAASRTTPAERAAETQAETTWRAGTSTSTVFSVYDHGAVGDGKHNNTDAIQKTLDAAADAGGGTAWLPENGTFLISGGVIDVHIHLDLASNPRHP